MSNVRKTVRNIRSLIRNVFLARESRIDTLQILRIDYGPCECLVNITNAFATSANEIRTQRMI